MPNTYTLIASNTLSSAAANITFSSIPSTYTDLLIRISARSNNTGSNIQLQFNGSAVSYTAMYLRGNGSAATSYTQTTFGTDAVYGTYLTSDASTFMSQDFYVPNYAGSTYKSVSGDGVEEMNQTLAYSMLTAGLWSNTAAITSVTIDNETSTLQPYTSAYLYGISKS